MTIRFFVNFALLAIPIGVTLGVLFGIQSHRQATGQAPLFAPGPSASPKPINGITESQYCQKSYGITPATKGQQFTLNPNQWNWNEGEPGSLCLNVTTFNNETYATDTTAPQFMVTWQYPPGPETDPVYAFPNIQVDGGVLPVPIDSLSKIMIDLEWSYGIGNQTTSASTTTELTAINLNTNVAFDMFIDSNKTAAQDPSKAEYELMVWFADIGPAAQPIGFSVGAVATQVLNGTTFSLYSGQNSLKQNVLTWVASQPTTQFTGDITPLFTELTKLTTATVPKTSDYLGYLALGSEAYSSDETVTFYVPELSIDLETSASTTT